MNRILLLCSILALTVGCATTDPVGHHRVGAVNHSVTPSCETVALTSSSTFSAGTSTAVIDTLGYNITTTGTWSGTYGLQESGDGTNWIDVTLPTTPPASTGSPQSFGLSYEGGWPWPYVRVKFGGTGSTGSASACPTLKG